jgi:Fe-S cluster assembly protein SufD
MKRENPLNTLRMKKNNFSFATPESFLAHLEAHPYFPQWLRELKQKAWERFNTLPMPNGKYEAWRFTNIKRINSKCFHQQNNYQACDKKFLQKNADLLSRFAGQTILADNHLAHKTDLPQEIKNKGVIWKPITQALHENHELLHKYFIKDLSRFNSEKFSTLHTAFNSNGILLYVPKNVQIELPLINYNWACSDGTGIFPHTIIVAEENAHVSVIDAFCSLNKEIENFACANTHIHAATNATVLYKTIQEWNKKTQFFHFNTINAQDNAYVHTININLGSGYMRHELDTRMVGRKSKAKTYSLVISSENQEFDHHTLQTHYAPHTISDLLFKNVLLDNSRTIFSGLIKVEEKAIQTNACQKNCNLLLSETAEANVVPSLEIKNNDVTCTHGATCSQLNKDNLFYLLSRGLSQRAATELMSLGFLKEILEQLQIKELTENIDSRIRKKMNSNLYLSNEH